VHMTSRYLGAGQDIGGTIITNSGSPSGATDLTNKGYVDNLVNGISWKNEVRAATTANGTLASAFANGSTLDTSVTLATGDRILLKNQTTQTENGIYTVNASGAPTRATDADATAELNNATVYVTDGTVNAGLAFTQTTKNPTVGSSNIVFAQVNAGTTYTASSGVTLTGANFTLDSAAAGNALTYSSGVLDVVAADTSLTVGANNIAVNPASSGGLTVSSGLKVDSTVARIFRTSTHASTTSIAITHSLGTAAVVSSVCVTSGGEVVSCDITNTSTTVTTFLFGSAPSANTLTFTIVG
jgi:hypothetical protein